MHRAIIKSLGIYTNLKRSICRHKIYSYFVYKFHDQLLALRQRCGGGQLKQPGHTGLLKRRATPAVKRGGSERLTRGPSSDGYVVHITIPVHLPACPPAAATDRAVNCWFHRSSIIWALISYFISYDNRCPKTQDLITEIGVISDRQTDTLALINSSWQSNTALFSCVGDVRNRTHDVRVRVTGPPWSKP